MRLELLLILACWRGNLYLLPLFYELGMGSEPGLVEHIYDLRTWEREVGRSQVLRHPGLVCWVVLCNVTQAKVI